MKAGKFVFKGLVLAAVLCAAVVGSVENRGGIRLVPINEVDSSANAPDSVAPADFTGLFEIREIDDSVFSRISGVSYPAKCIVPLEDLRYLVVPHYTLDGGVEIGELICNKLIADDLIDIFRNLFNARYPIESMRLVDDFGADDRASMSANNTSCFNFRNVAGTSKLSNHARGLAIDVNPRYNPYVKRKKNGTLYVSPENGREFADRNASFPYKIDENDLLYKEFKAHGFSWGGHWKTEKDYQHFQKKIPGLK